MKGDDIPVSDQFLDAVLSERSYYGPMIRSMARELREQRRIDGRKPTDEDWMR